MIFGFCSIIIFIYIAFLTLVIYGLLKPEKHYNKNDNVFISIIVPFRNEEQHLATLIAALNQQDYDKNFWEVVFVNDHSSDKGVEVLTLALKNSNFKHQITELKQGEYGKKKAIDKAISLAHFPFIITTDADSVPADKNWIRTYAQAFSKGADFVISPVINQKTDTRSTIEKLNGLEALVLAGVTIGSSQAGFPVLCSGANMGYKKSLYSSLSPYSDNFNVLSGDDMFFLDRVILERKTIYTNSCKKALVLTSAPSHYRQIIRQSIRWGGKLKHLKTKRGMWLGGITFLANVSLFICFACYFYSFNSFYLFIPLLKFLSDFALLFTISKKYKQKESFLFILLLFFVYPIHLLYIFVMPLFTPVNWKQRSIS